MLQDVGGQGGPGEEAQQYGRGAGDGQVGPLTLGLHTQVGPDFLEEPAPYLIRGDFQLPTQDKPLEDLGWVGAEQCLGIEGALGISYQHPANGDGRLARAVPDGGLRGEFHGAGGAVVPGRFGVGPADIGLVEQCFQRWSPGAFQRRSAILPRLTVGRWSIEGGVQAQSGNQSNRLTQGLAAVEEVEDRVAVVSHQHQGPMGQPPAQLYDHLPGPVGELLVPASLPLVVA